MYMDEGGMTLATEILGELKASARRWFIAFLVMLGIEAATIAGFLWYLSLPVEEETVTVENEDGNAMYLGDANSVIGGIHNGESKSNENSQAK